MGSLGLWSIIAALSSVLSTPDPGVALELGVPEPPTKSVEGPRDQPIGPRLFAASLDTFEVLSVASMKAQVRCIRTSMDTDDVESAPFTRSPRSFRRALDDAELAAPPDPPRYLRLTLDD